MKYYIIAGEASGDLHASNLVKHLFLNDKNAHVRAWGGDLLQKQGAEIVKNYKDMAFMGFIEVALNLKTVLKLLNFCKKDILAYKPDVVILVDYPGFNLRIAGFLHQQGIPVYYYISPQVWAWHTSRVKKIKKYVNEMFVILPFEKDFYAKHDFKVHYLGHPLLDAIETTSIDPDFKNTHHLNKKPILALLPGSRKQEIENMLPVMLKTATKFPDYQYVIAGVDNHKTLYLDICKDYPVHIVYNQTYSLLTHSNVALVTSGTATLETALFNVPQVVCYKGNYFSYLIAKYLIKNIQYISLVNLIANKQIVVELIQNDMNETSVYKELQKIIKDDGYRAEIFTNYRDLQQKMGNGNASALIANKIIEALG